MSVLMYRCPNTSQDVRTWIDTDPQRLTRLRTLKISVACPHCIGGHNILPRRCISGKYSGSCLLPSRAEATTLHPTKSHEGRGDRHRLVLTVERGAAVPGPAGQKLRRYLPLVRRGASKTINRRSRCPLSSEAQIVRLLEGPC